MSAREHTSEIHAEDTRYTCISRACLSLTRSCYRSCAHGRGLLCLQLRADDAANGSIQWKMTL